MGIEFKWQESWNQEPGRPDSENSPRRWWPPPLGVWVAVGVMLVLALGFGIWWVAQATSTLGRARSEVQIALQAEATALAANNLDAYLALQDPEDRSWQAYQRLRFAEQTQASSRQAGIPRVVDVGQNGERRWAEFEVVRQGIPYRQVQFYRQRGNAWFRSANVPDYWGRPLSLQIGSIEVKYSEREKRWIEPVITALDRAGSRMAATLGLNEVRPAKITFEFVHNEAGPRTATTELRFILSSPLFDGVRADGQPDPALLNTLTDDVAAVLVAEKAKAPFNAARVGGNWAIYNAAAGWLVDQALPQGVGAEQRRQALAQARQGQTEFSLPQVMATPQPNVRTQPVPDPAAIQALALIQFVSEKYDTEGMNRLLASMPPSATLPDALRDGLGIMPQAFDVMWQTWLKNR